MSTPPPLPAHNPYAAPLAAVEDAPVGEVVLADRLTRLGAAIVDGLAGFVLVIPAFVVLPFLQDGNRVNDVAMAVMGVLIVAGVIALLWINLLWLHRYGQTIGKRLLKIRIVRSDGSRCALSRIVFARWLPINLIGMVPLLGPLAQLVDILMIFRDDHRCLHDLTADTVVVRA